MAFIQELDHLKIPLKDILSATDNFADGYSIGEGGFGRVYKGQLPRSTAASRSTGTVAIKRLNIKGGQGQHEFLMEILMLSNYKHKNLVSLIGFSDEGDEKVIVYEYEVRGSLDKYLESTDLSWVQRLQICLGAARGLDYLHHGAGEGLRVLHRDVKSSNVLLDENWEAKISDFGLSKIGPRNQEFTFLVTNACGTFGYVDPQYVSTGVLTKESDVFSFGVVLFEVLCGRLAMIAKYDDERRFLSGLARHRYEKGRLDEIVTPHLLRQMSPDSLEKFSEIAYKCLDPDRKKRPTMGLVVEEIQTALLFQSGVEGAIPMGLWGSSNTGSRWTFKLESNQKLRKITIDHDNACIWGIGFTIENSDGSLHSTRIYGAGNGKGGQICEIKFDDDEEIIEMGGTFGVTWDNLVINSLYFVTNKGRHGPFGGKKGTTFSVPCEIGSFVGFYGTSGYFLDSIGLYLKKST